VFLFSQESPRADGAAETETAAGAVSGETDSAKAPEKTVEEQRRDTIRYGTDVEIASLIQALKNENAPYLDDELTALVQNTRNRNILSGVFAFFGSRAKEGLEDRALRAIEERDDEANETVLAAIEYLGAVRDAGAILPLEGLLDTEERRFMDTAFRALGRAAGGEGVEDSLRDETAEFLMDFYANRNPGDESQREIVIALGETGSAKGVPFLSDLAENNDARAPLRMAALRSLAQLQDTGGLDAVLKAVTSTDPNVRSAAVAALGPFSGPQVDDAVLEAFRDSYYRTRIAAALAAGERRLNQAVPYLRYRAERDDIPSVKDEAIRALGAIGNGEALEVLESLFGERSNSDRVRILTAEMLIKHEAGQYAERVIVELDEAQAKHQTPLYNGFLRVLGEAKTPKVEDLARRFLAGGGVVEKSYALDMALNNELRGLAGEIRALTADKNGSLARKAKSALEKLGLGD
jgi:HEAT repeat protein